MKTYKTKQACFLALMNGYRFPKNKKTIKIFKISVLAVIFPCVTAVSSVNALASTVPISSSLELTAIADIDFPDLQPVTDTDTQSQGSTLKTLSVAVSANAYIPPPDEVSAISKGEATASWSNAEIGSVDFFGVGWDTYHFGGGVSVGHGWSYQFVTDTDGVFNLSWDVRTDPTDYHEYPFLFCLSSGCAYDHTNFLSNTTGQVSFELAAGNIYNPTIVSTANVWGGVWNQSKHHDGYFDWSIKTGVVPLPSAFILFGSALAGLGIFGKRRKTF